MLRRAFVQLRWAGCRGIGHKRSGQRRRVERVRGCDRAARLERAVKRYGDAGIQGIYGAAVTPDGGAVVVGGFDGTIDFDGNPLLSAGGFDAFVAKLGSNGAHQWIRRDDIVLAGGFEGASPS